MGDRSSQNIGEDPWSGYDAAALLATSGDVSFLLSQRGEILDVVVPEKDKFDVDLRAYWRGRAFADIVAKDSVDKVISLLNLDEQSTPRRNRWRHLNFVLEDHQDIPLLAKNFRLHTPYGQVLQIVCRDLRPMTELNARWQNENRQLLKRAEDQSSIDPLSSSADTLVGAAPLADIMAAAADEVARICIDEALRSSGGDKTAAANLLGITVKELRQRCRKSFH